MKKLNGISAVFVLLVSSGTALAQMEQPSNPAAAAVFIDRQAIDARVPNTGTRVVPVADVTPEDGAVAAQRHADKSTATLDAQREKTAIKIFLKRVSAEIVGVAEAMPADQYGFAPTEGEFKGVRTFGQQVKHLAATNHILAAAALGEDPPVDAGDEAGPQTVRTKAEILSYLQDSFAHLGKAIDAIGEQNRMVKASPISPLRDAQATRLALVVESLVHAFDHYGQMVVYLRMVGVVPPASR